MSGKSAKDLFVEAVEMVGAERGAFLERECAGDAALRERVERLLAAHEGGGEFMGRPSGGGAGGAPGHSTVVAKLREGPGTKIGAYKLLQQIGEGGFGVVFMAEQEQPVRRRVALKIIKLGMDTRAVIARFEAERQALAMMDHPNIARVFDAGSTETGRPYFVMELVKGVPITEYADTNNLNTRERLELFVPVCRAVQHAHQKGIIHRDIKPANVLVTLHDGEPVAKVIDFGIAKATDHRLTEKTVFTEFRQLIGTPEYMSPEQAEMSGLDVDTRSDVYSLGVLLYELLTGTTPFDAMELRSKAYDQIQKMIREVDPPRPSVRISTLGETLTAVASHRKVEAGKLSRLVKGDLDWIVMRCLEKDRTRRYDTASDLAADVGRHLGGEAVEAAPPGVGYRVRKFVRRNRGVVAASVGITASLIAGGSIATWQWSVARRANHSLETSRQDAKNALIDIMAITKDWTKIVGPGYERDFAASGMTREAFHRYQAEAYVDGMKTGWRAGPEFGNPPAPPEDRIDLSLLAKFSLAEVRDTVGLRNSLSAANSTLLSQRAVAQEGVGRMMSILTDGVTTGPVVPQRTEGVTSGESDPLAYSIEFGIQLAESLRDERSKLRQSNEELTKAVNLDFRNGARSAQAFTASLGALFSAFAPSDGDPSFAEALAPLKSSLPANGTDSESSCGSCAMSYFLGRTVGIAVRPGPRAFEPEAEAALEMLIVWTAATWSDASFELVVHLVELAELQRDSGRNKSALTTIARAEALRKPPADDHQVAVYARLSSLKSWIDMDTTTLAAGHSLFMELRGQSSDKAAIAAQIEDHRRANPDVAQACAKYLELWR